MKTNNTISANLKGMAKHTYNRVMSAMAEDSDPAMLHTFAALTEGAKAIALQSGNFSNLYIRGINKGMTAEEAANEINARRYFINGKEVTANRYAAMKRLNAYIGRKQAEAFSRGDMDNIATRAAWFTYEAAADAEYSIARYIEDCRRLGYLKEETAAETNTPEFSELSHAENPDVLYRVTATASGIYSDFTDRHIAEKELQNLINNGKAATLIEIAL